jgi:hypothetical protein
VKEVQVRKGKVQETRVMEVKVANMNSESKCYEREG